MANARHPDETRRALKRMLANGPLAGVPKRPSDQQVLLGLAAAQFEPQRSYREAEVNETLKAWVGTFCEPEAIDHATLRRLLVDARLLTRTTSGSTYRVDVERLGQATDASAIDPAEVLAEIRTGRESRKRGRAASGSLGC